MSRLGVYFIVVLIAASSLCSPVSAMRGGQDCRWACGFVFNLFVENHDFWTPGIPGEIFFRLELLELGSVTYIGSLIMEVKVETDPVIVLLVTIPEPWDSVGDVLHLAARFNITPSMIHYAGWDTYVANFYYQINHTVIYDESLHTLYMYEEGPYPITMSTYQFMVLWPFPPILLMFFVYWSLYLGLRKFNRRYEGSFIPKRELLDREIEAEYRG